MTLNRLFVICLAIIAAAWLWEYAIDLQDRVASVPSAAPQSQPSDTFAPGGATSQWFERMNRHADNVMLRLNLFFAAVGLTWAWIMVTVVRNQVFWKKRNAPNRPADASAGSAIREIQGRVGSELIARTPKGGLHFLPYHEREVAINFAQRTATFRGFCFITRFVGNKPVRELTLPLADILGGRMWASHGKVLLNLRTTAGQVTIPDDVQPFQPVAAVLLDAAEVNRKNPTAYAAALAREPRVRTPRYAWLIIALALALLAGFVTFLWNLPAK